MKQGLRIPGPTQTRRNVYFFKLTLRFQVCQTCVPSLISQGSQVIAAVNPLYIEAWWNSLKARHAGSNIVFSCTGQFWAILLPEYVFFQTSGTQHAKCIFRCRAATSFTINLMIAFSVWWLVWSENGDQISPKPKMTSSDISFCPQSKDI